MYLISAEGYENADLHFLSVKKTDKIWASIKNTKDGGGVKSIFVRQKTLRKSKLKNTK